MVLAERIQHEIERFLAGEVSAAQLRQRFLLAATVQALAASQDPRAHELADRVMILFSEADYDDRSEDEIKQELAQLLAERQPFNWQVSDGVPPGVTNDNSSMVEQEASPHHAVVAA